MQSGTYKSKLEHYLQNHIGQNRALIEQNPDGIFVIDQSGYFVLMNNACEMIFGYPENTLLELKLTGFFQSDSSRIHLLLQKALKGELQNFDTSFHHYQRQKVHVNITFIPISAEDEIIGAFGIVKDITDVKNKHIELKRSQDIHRFLTENSLDIITRTDTNGFLTYVSPACHHILGYSPEELIGIFSGDIIHKDDVQGLITNFKSLLKGNKYGTLIFRTKHKDGHYIWMEAHSTAMNNPESGTVEAIASVIRDISERVTTEETYKSIIKHSPDAIIIADDHHLLFMNNQCLDLMDAKNKEEIEETDFFTLIAPEYIESIKERTQIVNQGSIADFIEMKIRTLSGREKLIETMVIPTTYQNKPARHIIIRDITERIHTQEMLLNSEKLTVAGQLAAGIAHEVRNPLTSIKGFIQLMEKLGSGKSEYFGIIHREINRINQILSGLLTLAKPQDTHFKTHDLYTLLEQVKILLGTQASMNNIIIETDFRNEQAITINCDENQLKQVFINFIKNSIEAMPNGGKITITVDTGANDVKLVFIDQGIGIPKEILSRIGEPFFTTKKKGTGLGLMISKQIIDNHNGKFAIQSSQYGTIIEITLPLEIK